MNHSHARCCEVSNPVPASPTFSPAEKGIRSPGKPLDPLPRAAMEARFGHDFSRVRIHAEAEAGDAARALNARAFAYGSDVVFGAGAYRPESRAGRALLAHELTHVLQQSRSATAPSIARAGIRTTESQDPQEQEAQRMERAVEDDGGEIATGGVDCPLTARFSSIVLGSQKANCLVPQGSFGASTLAHFVLSPAPAADVTITEQFTALDDPYGAFGLLKANSFTTSGGSFDDCYGLFSKKELPQDFSLKVEQNHLLAGKVLSKNHITYTRDRVHMCAFTRKPQSCDFGARCR